MNFLSVFSLYNLIILKISSDLILFLMDSRSEITANDRELSQKVIRSGKPYIFILNKIDTESLENNKDQFYELGLDEPVLVSAQTGYNLGNLLDIIVSKLPSKKNDENLYFYFFHCYRTIISLSNYC